jgi:rubrerythrin
MRAPNSRLTRQRLEAGGRNPRHVATKVVAMKTLAELTEREILALAISSEEEDSRIYMTFAEDLTERYPASAKMFVEMAAEEEGHRHRLLKLYQQRFGSRLPPIRREDVKGFLRRRPIWLTRNLPLDTIRKEAENMEFQAVRFYDKAAECATDVGVRKLLGDLAAAERGAKHKPRLLIYNVACAFGHFVAPRIRLAAWTMFMRAGRTSSHLRVLRPQSGLTHI